MIFHAKTVTLKDGTAAVLRSPGREDAAEMLSLFQACLTETEFLLTSPEEGSMTAEQEAAYLEKLAASENDLMITCFINGKAVGNCSLQCRSKIKTRHRASVGLSILKQYWNRGIGTLFFEELIRVAREKQILQMELEYIDGNERGRHLYEKMGFVQAAEHPNFIRQKDGSLVNEYLMIRKIE